MDLSNFARTLTDHLNDNEGALDLDGMKNYCRMILENGDSTAESQVLEALQVHIKFLFSSSEKHFQTSLMVLEKFELDDKFMKIKDPRGLRIGATFVVSPP